MIGGIHTVIVSKVPYIKKLASRYICLGPYREHNHEFLEKEVPEEFKEAFKRLKNLGIILHFGNWDLDSRPKVILIEYLGYSEHINEIKKTLWDNYKIDSLGSDWHDFDEVCLWSWCCGIVIEELSKEIKEEEIYVHAHEWIAGASLLYLDLLDDLRFKKVFTTHATMIARAYFGRGGELSELEHLDCDVLAREMNVHTKHQLEKTLAFKADCFTTVSDITAKEIEHVFGKEVDVIVYNGIESEKISDSGLYQRYLESKVELASLAQKLTPEKIVMSNSTFCYTSGRNEFRNKGFDVVIKAFGKLNEKLKKEASQKLIVFFILVPFGEYALREEFSTKKKCKEFTLSTHRVPEDHEYMITLRDSGLNNSKDDKVRVVLVPEYINKESRIFSKTYHDVVVGFDYALFASKYEPWGYTPVESIAQGVPALISNLTGFAQYLKKEGSESVDVIRRRGDEGEVIDKIVSKIDSFIHKNPKEQCNLKVKARHFSKKFDWSIFIKQYEKAYEFASKNK